MLAVQGNCSKVTIHDTAASCHSIKGRLLPAPPHCPVDHLLALSKVEIGTLCKREEEHGEEYTKKEKLRHACSLIIKKGCMEVQNSITR